MMHSGIAVCTLMTSCALLRPSLIRQHPSIPQQAPSDDDKPRLHWIKSKASQPVRTQRHQPSLAQQPSLPVRTAISVANLLIIAGFIAGPSRP